MNNLLCSVLLISVTAVILIDADCLTYPNVTNSNLKKDCGNVEITCQKGYYMVQGIVCIDEEWTYQKPICTAKDCGPLPQGNSSKGTVNGSTLFPNTASYTCDEGHEPVSGEPEISCLASGKWETDVLVCQRIMTKDCGSEPLDLVFVVDGSSSVNSESYDKMIDEIADFNSISLNVNSMTVNVGLVNSDSNFDFSSDVIILSSDSNQVLGKIRALKHQGGSSDYAFSINTAKNSIFDDFRPEVQDVIILLSAGVSSVNPQSKASDAKGAGIKIFTIGIGDSVDRDELKGIASDPTEAKFINFFSDIRATLHDLVNDFC